MRHWLRHPAFLDALIVGSLVVAFACLFGWHISLEQAVVLILMGALNFAIVHWPEATRRP